MKRHFLIIDARFYTDLADELVKGFPPSLKSAAQPSSGCPLTGRA